MTILADTQAAYAVAVKVETVIIATLETRDPALVENIEFYNVLCGRIEHTLTLIRRKVEETVKFQRRLP